MINRYFLRSLAFALPLMGLMACAPTSNTAQQVSPSASATESPVSAPTESPSITESAGRDLTPLFSKIWRVSEAPSEPALGSINVFLPNGTLLQTSCVETYLIGGWTIDKEQPNVLQVSENGMPAYTAQIVELTDTTLQLQLTLTQTNETQNITLTAVEDEFVCPDLPR